ncbi:MAG TPA: hypothetical protein VFI04_04940 [Gaiellaceae bacterium]|jgi:hypothetical protein|nr:hypothetical protein [Gaiellaceae bacterium]
MFDVQLRTMIVNDRIETLRRAAYRAPAAPARRRPEDLDGVELRLCKPLDDPALERLAALAERPVPEGRLVVALVCGEIVAALPLAGGAALADPFRRSAHVLPLLELRAAQLRPRRPRRPLVPRLLGRHA